MKVVNIASGNSAWRGLNYFKEKKIIKYDKISDFEYKGKVKGSKKEVYDIFLDIEHPRKSKCNCPHAKDRRVICKHIVALYFTIFPQAAENFIKEQEKAQEEYEEYQNVLYEKTIKYIYSMPKKDLQEALIAILNISPDFVYERFVRDHIDY